MGYLYAKRKEIQSVKKKVSKKRREENVKMKREKPTNQI
jgi:hypothetical protein